MNAPLTTKPSNYPHREEMWSSILVSISKLMKEPHLVTSEDLQELDTYLANSVAELRQARKPSGLARMVTAASRPQSLDCTACGAPYRYGDGRIYHAGHCIHA